MDERTGIPARVLSWAFVGSGLGLSGIHLYLGLVADAGPSERTMQFTAIGLVFLLGLGVYATRYWRSILYLVLASFAVYLGALWIIAGMEFFRYGVATGAVAIAFVLTASALFLREGINASRQR